MSGGLRLTDAWYALRPHPEQRRLWTTRARFCAVAAGRGSGKTELARRRVVRMLAVKKPWPDPMYFYALPTREQAKRVAWRALKALVPQHWLAGPNAINESELRIDTVFGSSLWLVGMDKPQRVEGNQWDGGVIDESSDQKPSAFDRSVLPALSHRAGWCWRIGVPKRFGPGARDFKEFFEEGLKDSSPDAKLQSFTWESADIAPLEEIEWARAHLDEKDFNEQYRARWEDPAGLIFYGFSRANVSDSVRYDPLKPLLIGSDFNVDPMAWVVGQDHDGTLHVHDEIWMRNTNTPASLNELYRRYPEHSSGWVFCGDAAGRARKSSATKSDYQWLKSDERFRRAIIKYPMSNPAVADRFATTNAMLLNANGQRRVLIHPRCKRLIADLESRAYIEGSREPDDSAHDSGHITDALGYLIYERYPVRWGSQGTSEVKVK